MEQFRSFAMKNILANKPTQFSNITGIRKLTKLLFLRAFPMVIPFKTENSAELVRSYSKTEWSRKLVPNLSTCEKKC